MLDETIVIWAGEFGRTPFSQGRMVGSQPFGFSIWMAGGGIKGAQFMEKQMNSVIMSLKTNAISMIFGLLYYIN